MSTARTDAIDLFVARFGKAPAKTCSAPGRVNLIGEHTDYNQGFVLPLIIEKRCFAAGDRGGDAGFVEVTSREFGETVRFRIGDDAMRKRGWAAYVAGVVAQINARKSLRDGLRISIAADIPVGAGLSSSAALEVAVARLICELSEFELDGMALAKLCMRAEHEYAGVPCGLMDQAVVSAGREGFAMLIDCRDESFEHVPLPHGFELLILDSGVKHAHGAGEFRKRVEECAQAAVALGVASLRDGEGLDLSFLPPLLRRRAEHVTEENRRVLRAVDMLRCQDLSGLGELLKSSHQSLRDDFEVSCPEVDALVEHASGVRGVYGARMTGGGFGGSVIVTGERAALDELARHTERFVGVDRVSRAPLLP